AMPRPFRSNLPRGSSHWAVRRAQWAALGIGGEDLEKPKIAIVNSSSDLAICFSHLDGVAREVRAAIREAGGLPFEIRTAAPADFIHSAGRAGRYILPSRDLIANDIEVQVEGAQLDGMVLLASCDKTLPGQLMAAAQLDIPTIVVVCGYQPSGEWNGHEVDIEEVFLAAGHHAAGRLPLEDLAGMADNAIRGPGVCAGMGTANSMHIVGEALGMTLPGAAPVLANSPAMFAQARAAGARIVAMVEEDLRPRRILTAGAFANAVTALLSVAGSINCIKHLQAVAAEAGLALDMRALAERLSERVPVLCAIRPIGALPTEAMEQAGGAWTLLSRLRPLLDGTAITVTGRSLGSVLDSAPEGDARVIRPLSDPLSKGPGIVMLRGSLCPGGGLVKLGLGEGRVLAFEGRARVFETVDAALAALREGRIAAGDVMVLRNLGVRGAPGMGMASRVVFALDGLGLGPQVAVVTDGQLSGLVNKGIVVGECAPEAADGGAIGLVREGDRIRIDIPARRADLLVSEEIAARRAAPPPAAAAPPPGWLSIYARTAKPLEAGATLHDPPGT
ncbi:MAG: dihydroxy-acid dehydratase, partial [Acetobacteraceae bacterium]|nr:dihydroxy-acid dehydratase [Acetobacteraceae bacterium]